MITTPLTIITVLQEAAQAAPDWLSEMIFRYGLPTAILILLIAFLYRDLWPWIRGHVDGWVSRTNRQVEEANIQLTQERARMAEVMRANTQVLQEISVNLRGLREGQEDFDKTQREILETVRGLTEERRVKGDLHSLREEVRRLRTHIEAQNRTPS